MSKSRQLASKLFGDQFQEKFPPGDVTRKDVFRNYLWHVGGNPLVKKNLQSGFKATVAKSLLSHWGIPADPKVVYDKHLKYTKTIVTKVVNEGTYLQHCGSRLDEPAFIEEKTKWFSEIVCLKNDNKTVIVEVSFEVLKQCLRRVLQPCQNISN